MTAQPLVPLLCRLLPFLPLFLSGETIPGDAGKAEAARKILDAYHSADPQPAERKLHIICWRPTDRDFAANHRERIPRMMKHIQDFFADEMERNGFGRLSFNLDQNDDGTLRIHEATGEGTFADYGRPDGQRIKEECWPVLKEAGIDPDRETVLIFTNLSDWDPVKKTFVHKSPYYAGGSAKQGTAWQLDSPELDTVHLVRKRPMIQDGEYGRISLGKHNSIFIGGIAHEMGHAFGLPHCRARNEEAKAFGTALMGSGNRTYADEVRGEGKGTFLTLAHALRLASHPQFSGSVRGLYLPAKTEFTDLAVKSEATSFVVRGRVESTLPIYAVIGYLDPEGGADYDSRTVVTVPDEEGRFTLPCDALVSGRRADIRIVACLVNGSTHTWRGGYQVAPDGNVDIAALAAAIELAGFVAALRQRDFPSARSLRDQLADGGKLRSIADSVLEGMNRNRRTTAASEVPAGLTTYPLSRITTAEAEVGWMAPAYDHLPGPDPLLISAGEAFVTGIYAHAESRHRYDLSNGSWTRLTGKCGLPNRPGGSVVFVIRADGKEVFRSPPTKPGQLHAYDLDLEGVTDLELMTRDGGDGKNSDWGIWFDPHLHR